MFASNYKLPTVTIVKRVNLPADRYQRIVLKVDHLVEDRNVFTVRCSWFY